MLPVICATTDIESAEVQVPARRRRSAYAEPGKRNAGSEHAKKAKMSSFADLSAQVMTCQHRMALTLGEMSAIVSQSQTNAEA
jgi:hypothetical protein